MIELLRSISTPIVWILAFLISGLMLTGNLRKKPRLNVGWYFLVFATCILYFLSISPVSNLLVYSLECQYQPPSREVLEEVDMMVVLGGGVMSSGGFRKYPEASGATYSRIFNGVKMFRQSGAKVLVLSGAGGQRDGETNADVMKDIAIALGISENKIIAEGGSRNTMEHAIELSKLFPPEEGMRIGIVTSALHMKRAVVAFYEKFPQHSIIPIPVGYLYSPQDWSIDSIIPSAEAFSASSYAIHEWIGMLWYRITY